MINDNLEIFKMIADTFTAFNWSRFKTRRVLEYRLSFIEVGIFRFYQSKDI